MKEIESTPVLRTVARAGLAGRRPRRSPDPEQRVAAFPERGSAAGALGYLESFRKGVLTVSTRLASDRVVHRPDWLGLIMFSGVPSVCKGWNAV